jgi:hypothetical protein
MKGLEFERKRNSKVFKRFKLLAGNVSNMQHTLIFTSYRAVSVAGETESFMTNYAGFAHRTTEGTNLKL